MRKEKVIKIKSKRLVISPMTDEEMTALIGSSDEEMQAAYSEMLTGAKEHPEVRPWYIAWKICLKKEPDKMVGDLCFKGPQEKGRVEVGYGILPEYEGQGYATEAVKAVCEWAFSEKDVYYVEAETDPDNSASQRVLEKNGFAVTGKTGEEGPRFELKKPSSSWIAIFMCFGVSIGFAIGTTMGNIALSPIGIAVGVAVGAALDNYEKKHRAEVCGETEQKQQDKTN